MSAIGLANKTNIKLEIIEDIESGKELFLSVTQRQQLARVLKVSPKEIKQYRIELYKAGYGRTLDYIENMEQLLNRGYNIFNYVVIDTNKFKKLIDGIYADYPSTIQELHKLTNS